jgi:hypothetical protein
VDNCGVLIFSGVCRVDVTATKEAPVPDNVTRAIERHLRRHLGRIHATARCQRLCQFQLVGEEGIGPEGRRAGEIYAELRGMKKEPDPVTSDANRTCTTRIPRVYGCLTIDDQESYFDP